MSNKPSSKPLIFALALAQDEEGGAYTLSYVMVIPILMLLTCLIVESTQLMVAKTGTHYAAFSGARTGIVWSSANRNWNEVQERIEQAAVQSFVPFCSGTGSQGSAPARADAYVSSYSEFVNQPVSESYIRAKYANSKTRLKVTVDGPPATHNSDIQVTVEYRFRFNIPGIGRLLGEQDGEGYYFPLKSTATLQNEGPKNKNQELGIGYGTLE